MGCGASAPQLEVSPEAMEAAKADLEHFQESRALSRKYNDDRIGFGLSMSHTEYTAKLNGLNMAAQLAMKADPRAMAWEAKKAAAAEESAEVKEHVKRMTALLESGTKSFSTDYKREAELTAALFKTMPGLVHFAPTLKSLAAYKEYELIKLTDPRYHEQELRDLQNEYDLQPEQAKLGIRHRLLQYGKVGVQDV